MCVRVYVSVCVFYGFIHVRFCYIRLPVISSIFSLSLRPVLPPSPEILQPIHNDQYQSLPHNQSSLTSQSIAPHPIHNYQYQSLPHNQPNLTSPVKRSHTQSTMISTTRSSPLTNRKLSSLNYTNINYTNINYTNTSLDFVTSIFCFSHDIPYTTRKLLPKLYTTLL